MLHHFLQPTVFSLIGNFVTNEILTEKKFIRFLDENNLSDDYPF